MPDTSRQALRTQELAFNNLNRLSTKLGSGEVLAQGDPPVEPGPDLAAKFVYALDAIAVQDWKGFAQQCGATVSNDPLEFGKAILIGIYEFLKSEVEFYMGLGSSLLKWTSNAYDCISDVGSGIVDPDQVLRSAACKPFHGAAQGILAVRDTIQDLAALGIAGVIELARSMFQLAMEQLDDLLAKGLQLFGDLWDEIRDWLHDLSHDVMELGQVVGGLLGAIILEIATAGVGRALKAAKVVTKLPDSNLTGTSPLLMDSLATEFSTLASITSRARRTRSERMIKNLDALAEAFQNELNKNRRRFSRNMTAKKLAILQKHIPPEEFVKFKRWRREAAKALADEFDELQGRIKKYSASTAEVADYNRRVLTFHYAEAVVEDDFIDYWNILVRKDAVMPNVFEANHIIEERLFHRRKTLWKNEFDRLGWNSPADMESVLMTASEHTGSARAMLTRQGLTPSDIDAIAPPKSITVTLLERIKFREDWPGPPGEGMLIVEADTPFRTVFEKYVDIYRKESPALWDKSVRNAFCQWRDKLNLGAVPGLTC